MTYYHYSLCLIDYYFYLSIRIIAFNYAYWSAQEITSNFLNKYLCYTSLQYCLNYYYYDSYSEVLTYPKLTSNCD